MNWPAEQEHLKALFDAYVETSGRALTPSHQRKRVLREFDRRGFTADDVRAVLGELQRRMARGVQGYTDTSLDWKNAMGDVDRFEERLALLRQARARRRGTAPRPEAAQTRALPGGGTVSVLAPASEAEAESIRDAARKELDALKKKLGREGS